MTKPKTSTAPAALLSNSEAVDKVEAAFDALKEAGGDLDAAFKLRRSGQAKMLAALTVPGVWDKMIEFNVETENGLALEVATLSEYVRKVAPFVDDDGKDVRKAQTGFKNHMLAHMGQPDPKAKSAASVWTSFGKCARTALILNRENLIATEEDGKVRLAHEDGTPAEELEQDARDLLTAAASGTAEPLHNEAARIASGKPKQVSQRAARVAASKAAKEVNVLAVLTNADKMLGELVKQVAGDETDVALTPDQLKMIQRIAANAAKLINANA